MFFSSGGVSPQFVNRGICWSNIISEPTISNDNTWDKFLGGIGSYTCTMIDLTPGTIYYVRAYAYNCLLGSPSNGCTGYGNVVSFTTTGSVVGNIVFNPDVTYGSLTDIDGNIYKAIKIGSQTWIAENLKTTKYNDGTDIPDVTDLTYWFRRTTPAYCWYLNDAATYKNTYGALYNWYTVNTGKLCPTGWHVPSDAEWTTLTTYLGGDSIAGGKLKETGTTHWITTYAGVTNSYGFTALPGGNRWGVQTEPLSYFEDLGYRGYFWSTAEYNDLGYGFYGGYDWFFSKNSAHCGRSIDEKSQGLSVRCIKDN